MKIALYIEDGFEQIALTLQSDTERHLLEKLHDGSRVVSIKKGGFYHCRGGWLREADPMSNDGTMIVLEKAIPKEDA